MADPAPVLQTFFVDDELQASYQLDAVITVVDAKHIVMHLDEEKPEGVENESGVLLCILCTLCTLCTSSACHMLWVGVWQGAAHQPEGRWLVLHSRLCSPSAFYSTMPQLNCPG